MASRKVIPMAEGKTSFKQMAEALSRAKSKAESIKEHGEKIGTEVTRTVIGGVSSFACGFANQRFGAADAETGIRMHKTNGAPTSLLVGLGIKGAGLFGAFGKADMPAFAVGDGAINSTLDAAGRQAGERFRRKADKVQAADKAETKASEAAPQAATGGR